MDRRTEPTIVAETYEDQWRKRLGPKPKSRFWHCAVAQEPCELWRSSTPRDAALNALSRAQSLRGLPGQVLSGTGWLDSARGCLFSRAGSLDTGECASGQDAVVLWEGVGGDPEAVICAVMDGHGPHGAGVANAVAGILPRAVAARLRAVKESQPGELVDEGESLPSPGSDRVCIRTWSSGLSEVSSEAESEYSSPETGSPTSQSAGSLAALSLDGRGSSLASPREVEMSLGERKMSSLQGGPSTGFMKALEAQVRKESSGVVEEAIAAVSPSLLEDAFSEVNDAVRRDPRVFPLCSGSTATVALLMGNQLTVAHVGDSRCVLGVDGAGGAAEAIQLTVDHRPSEQSERRRIEESGGRVRAFRNEPSVPRVFAPSNNAAGLAVTRSIGDELLKDRGVTCTPDIMRVSLDGSARFLVLGTSGLWNCITPSAAVRTVAGCPDRVQAADRLVSLARQRWAEVQGPDGIEDVSAVVYFLKPLEVSPKQAPVQRAGNHRL